MEFTQQLEQAQHRLVTIRDVVRFMVSKFNQHGLCYGHGTTNAFDEAVSLVLQTLHLPIDELEPYWEAKLVDSEINQLLTACSLRIEKRLPLPYITNKAYFLGYEFYVDSRVIIPRSFIGELIANQKLDEYIQHPELVHNVLDLCTGNGSIAIIAAEYFYDSQVIASDINSDALAVAKININHHGLEKQIELRQSDLFANLGDCQSKFDLILTNPPYVDTQRMDTLPPEYLHEPNISLAGGSDGLEFIDKILKNSQQFLSEFGILILEMGDNQLELEDKYPGLNFQWLDTASGDGVVFLLTKCDLNDYFGTME